MTGQQETNIRYAERHGIEILRTYIDDGESAKDFDRPQWKKLMKDLEANKKTIDYLIVMKYDRLIRNAAAGLMALEKIEKRWFVKVLGASEHISIDPHSPFFFKFRADMLVNAEFERMVISDRSKFGVWRAKTEGRFLGRAPFGYYNDRDSENKPIIVIDEAKAEIVKQMYELYSKGRSIAEISKHVLSQGFDLNGHMAVQRVLTNSVYAGLIEVPAFKDDVARTVEGKHIPIVSKHIFYSISNKINSKTQKHTTLNDEVYLRGIVKCNCCNQNLTAGKSKGKLKHYWYYLCNTCRKENINANRAHDLLGGILEHLSLKPEYVDKILEVAKKELDQHLAHSKVEERKLIASREQLREKLNSLEEKYISDLIDNSTYKKWAGIYRRDLAGLDNKIERLNKDVNAYWKLLEMQLPKLTNLNYLMSKLSTPDKQELMTCLFSSEIRLTIKSYRTPYVLPIFLDNARNINGLDIIKTGHIDLQKTNSPVSTRSGT